MYIENRPREEIKPFWGKVLSGCHEKLESVLKSALVYQ